MQIGLLKKKNEEDHHAVPPVIYQLGGIIRAAHKFCKFDTGLNEALMFAQWRLQDFRGNKTLGWTLLHVVTNNSSAARDPSSITHLDCPLRIWWRHDVMPGKAFRYDGDSMFYALVLLQIGIRPMSRECAQPYTSKLSAAIHTLTSGLDIEVVEIRPRG